MVGTHSPRKSRSSSVIRWVIVGIAALVLFVILWVAIRALMARNELLSAIPIAQSIGADGLSVLGNDVSDEVIALQHHSARAQSLTSDVIWRAAEVLPFLGPNLTAFREAAAMVNSVTEEALPPLAELAETFTMDSLSPQNGSFDLQVFRDASPLLDESSIALDKADSMASAIDTSNTVEQIGTAVDQVKSLVTQARDAVGGLDTAARLLPSMLGGDASPVVAKQF
jgi:hypothetical protein